MSSRLRGEGVDAGRHHKNQATTTGLLNHSIVITLYQQQPSGLKRLLNTNATTFLIPKHTGGLQSLLFITLNVNFLLQTFFWLQVSVSTKYSVTSLTMSATSWAWTQSSLGPIGWSWLFCPFRHSPSGQLSSCSDRHQVRYTLVLCLCKNSTHLQLNTELPGQRELLQNETQANIPPVAKLPLKFTKIIIYHLA